MDILDIFAEVRNSCFGRLIRIAVGVVHIPKSCHLAACNAVKYLCETICIAVNTVCLNKESNVVLLCDRNELPE